MAANPATLPTGVAVTRTTVGRGTQHFTYSGTSADAVLAAALRAWNDADPWLRDPTRPVVWRDADLFKADIRIWGAE